MKHDAPPVTGMALSTPPLPLPLPPAPDAPFLSVRALVKAYGDMKAVDRLDLDVRKGEMVAFLGPSGCGKTTSLRMIAGLVPATSGQILVDGRDITRAPPYKRDMGLVFQSYALFPHLDVARNVAFGLEMRKVPRAEAKRRVAEAIELVHLAGRENRKPGQLSGGQQQRVALARALVIRPSILLLDEPLSNLDAKLRDEMRTEIREIQKRLGITSIFVTHDQQEALTMCDRVAVLNNGRLEQLGTPSELYERPATAFVAAFVGRTNRLRGTARKGANGRSSVDLGGLHLKVAGDHDGPVEVMIRPHRIRMETGTPTEGDADTVNRLPARVVRVVYAGDTIQTELEVGGVVIAVEQPNLRAGEMAAPGAQVTLGVLVADTLVFPASA